MRKTKSALRYAFLIIVSFVSVFPLYWMVVSATNANVDVIRGSLLPGGHLVENFTNLTTKYPYFYSAMLNSFRNATILTLVSLLVCSLAGYGFEIYHSKAKDRLMGVLLLAMMIPFASIMIPLYQMFGQLGFLNSVVGFILPTISTPFLIMMFRQSARSFPHDIIEAARLDGLNEWNIFFRMFIPTMRSTYAAAMTITFMSAWNVYLWPKIIMQTDNMLTMPMLVANTISGYVTDLGLVMLAVLFTTIPTVVIFFFLQKSFAEGITGAVK